MTGHLRSDLRSDDEKLSSSHRGSFPYVFPTSLWEFGSTVCFHWAGGQALSSRGQVRRTQFSHTASKLHSLLQLIRLKHKQTAEAHICTKRRIIFLRPQLGTLFMFYVKYRIKATICQLKRGCKDLKLYRILHFTRL